MFFEVSVVKAFVKLVFSTVGPSRGKSRKVEEEGK